MELFVTKRLDSLDAAADKPGLKRHLGPFGLIALGVGMIVGAGLFSLTGIAAGANAGPAVTLSFLVAALGCAFAGMCYSELSTMIPVSGSAYTYAYATLGELVAWIIGWDLVLEYAVGASAVAVSWSKYALSLLHDFGIAFPAALTIGPFETVKLAGGATQSGAINLPAIFVVVALSLLLMRGIRESSSVNNVIVVIKLAIVAVFVAVGFSYIDWHNYTPFIPPNAGTFGEYGWSGVLRGAGVIFFAYIGFDAVATGSEEAKNPKRDLPVAIIGSLVICTIIYILVSIGAVGTLPAAQLAESDAPLSLALEEGAGLPWAASLTAFGALVAITSVLLVILYGQTRIFFAMA
ncbi:MAG TPA: amino acid permease, partial [Stellaceae bacterium]|nr:amino acid permease [Stellaceae bacterium]